MSEIIGYFGDDSFNRLQLLEEREATISEITKLDGKMISVAREVAVFLYTDMEGKLVPVTSTYENQEEAGVDNKKCIFVGKLKQHVINLSPSFVKKNMGQNFDEIMRTLKDTNSQDNPVEALSKSDLGRKIEVEKIRRQLDVVTGNNGKRRARLRI